jgi:hypothetical protein
VLVSPLVGWDVILVCWGVCQFFHWWPHLHRGCWGLYGVCDLIQTKEHLLLFWGFLIVISVWLLHWICWRIPTVLFRVSKLVWSLLCRFCFSSATNVTLTRLQCHFMRTLRVCLMVRVVVATCSWIHDVGDFIDSLLVGFRPTLLQLVSYLTPHKPNYFWIVPPPPNHVVSSLGHQINCSNTQK